MNGSSVVWGTAAAFAGLAVVLFVVGVVYTPVAWAVALPFVVAAYILWYHASGRLQRRVARITADEGRRRQRRRRQRRSNTRADGRRRRRVRTERRQSTEDDAYRALGLEPGAGEAAVRRAYRERVKEVHPDRTDGDEREFKRVTAAYERLTSESP